MKHRRYARYLLTTPALVTSDTRWREIESYRRRHRGIGFDEVFNLRRALALFLLPRLRLRIREMRDVSEQTIGRDGGARDTLPRCTDEAVGALYKILDGKALESYEIHSLLEVVRMLLRE